MTISFLHVGNPKNYDYMYESGNDNYGVNRWGKPFYWILLWVALVTFIWWRFFK